MGSTCGSLPRRSASPAGSSPFFIRTANPHDVRPLTGIYEFWLHSDKPDGAPDAWLTSFTTTATEDVGRIHDRMPMAVMPELWEAWLNPRFSDVDEIRDLMAPPTGLEIYVISKAVNDVREQRAGTAWAGPAEPPPVEGR
jgi:putative SOS response-associated peptidase YedK